MGLRNVITQVRQTLGSFITGKSLDDWWHQFSREGSSEGYGENPRLTAPYANSVWVMRAIQHIAGPISMRSLSFLNLDQSPLVDPELTAFWQMPATNVEGPMSLSDFIHATVIWMELHGQAFWILDDSWLNPYASPKSRSPLFLAREDRMKPIRNYDELIGWVFIDRNHKQHYLLPEQVVRPKFYNPYDELLGLPPWYAARIAASSDYSAGVLAKNINDSNGDRGVWVIAKEGVVDEAQRAQIERTLREKREMNRRGIFKAAFLTGDIEIEDPKVETVGSDFVASRLENRHEVFSAFGVPPSMADVTSSYSVGSASDRYRLIEETCMPVGKMILSAITLVERRRSARQVIPELDWDNHSTMQQVRSERAQIANNFLQRGMPFSVASRWLGLKIPAFNGWDKGYGPAINAVIAQDPEEATPEVTVEDEEMDQDTEFKKLPESVRTIDASFNKLATLMQSRCSEQKDVPASPGSTGGNKPALTQRKEEQAPAEPDASRSEVWEAHMRLQAVSEKRLMNAIGKCLTWARKQTLANLESTKGLTHRAAGVSDIMFSLSTFTGKMVTGTQTAIRATYDESTDQAVSEVQPDAENPWQSEDQDVIKFCKSREGGIKDASQAIYDEVKQTVADGLDAGKSNAAIADDIRNKFNDIGTGRAKTIARTENNVAYNTARIAGFKGMGIKYKQWLTGEDDKVRETHAEVDRKTIPIDEAFEVGGEEMQHPGDPNASAKNVCNCRCVILASRKPKQ